MKEMLRIRDLSELPNGYSFSELDIIDDLGQKADIVNINGLAGKVLRYPFEGLPMNLTLISHANRLVHEHNVAVDLYRQQISVPEPYQIVLADKLSPSSGEVLGTFPVFLMEYLEEYIPSGKIERPFYRRVFQLQSSLIEQIRSAGWDPVDIRAPGNVMYSIEKDNLKAVDFADYRRI